MNKSICIFLCILLIFFAFSFIYAADYYYSTTTDFCSAINPNIPYVAASTSASQTVFVDAFNSAGQTLYNACINHFSINTDIIAYSVYYKSGSYNYLEIITTSENPKSNSYVDLSNGVGIVLGFDNTNTYNRYKIRDGVYQYNQYTNASAYYSNTSSNYIYGILPGRIAIRPTSISEDTYYLGYVDPNPPTPSDPTFDNPGYDFETYFNPPWNINNIFSSTYTPYMYYSYEYLATNYPNATHEDRIRLYAASFFNMWEYYQRWYMNCNLRYQSSLYDLLNTRMEDLNYMSNNIDLLTSIYASEQEIEAREAATDNQQTVVDNFLDSQGDGSVSASNLGELADSSAEIKSNFNTGYSASGVWDVFDRNWDWFSNTTKNNLEPSAQNTRSANDYETPFLDNAINEILHLRGN